MTYSTRSTLVFAAGGQAITGFLPSARRRLSSSTNVTTSTVFSTFPRSSQQRAPRSSEPATPRRIFVGRGLAPTAARSRISPRNAETHLLTAPIPMLALILPTTAGLLTPSLDGQARPSLHLAVARLLNAQAAR
ncbi:uncharacterized protein LOC62_01G001341 [Vanrija pseudolonga]|uniref:Uncharacterized protein n=1 Tax=Vanrija pseudolonga TaxID=143232 RepID=A0AAF0Y3Z7_9TREE|nr:hypothetical protein LOC62_01G001341 [Vanrija pseudolonga]